MPSRTPPAFLVALILLNLWAAFATAGVPLARSSVNGQSAQTRTQSPAIPVSAAARSRVLFPCRSIEPIALEIGASQHVIAIQRLSHPATIVDPRLFSLRI